MSRNSGGSPAGICRSSASPSAATSAIWSGSPAGWIARSSTSWMFRWNGVAAATSPRSASSAKRSNRRGASAAQIDVTSTSTTRPRTATRPSRKRRIARLSDATYSSPERRTVLMPARPTWRVTIATVTTNRTTAAP